MPLARPYAFFAKRFCCGAENEIRTRGLDHGKVALYRLSYFRTDHTYTAKHREGRLAIQAWPEKFSRLLNNNSSHWALCQGRPRNKKGLTAIAVLQRPRKNKKPGGLGDIRALRAIDLTVG